MYARYTYLHRDKSALNNAVASKFWRSMFRSHSIVQSAFAPVKVYCAYIIYVPVNSQ